MYIVVGLGNPGTEYRHTRHNVGRVSAELVEQKELKGVKVIHPDTYMNRTGGAVLKAVKSKKAAEKLVVIYDDLDLPLGSFKISYNRSSGGHRGVESIIKALKTKEFIRIRVGISPTTPKGNLKKPKGEDAVQKFILTDFKKNEEEVLKKVYKQVVSAVEMIVEGGLSVAMTKFN
jgi:peptidyl-tRNA hydrolase, PTH1 family